MGQLSFVFWWPSPSLSKRMKGRNKNKTLHIFVYIHTTGRIKTLPVNVVITGISYKVIVRVRLRADKTNTRSELGQQMNILQVVIWFVTWLGFGISGQLSQASPTPSLSLSLWSRLGTRWQLSRIFFKPEKINT